ncbi:MAG: hypothetical protein ACREYF_07440 [Gammaproteobacteria bacterium]
MCHAILLDANLYTFLFQIDRDLAAETRASGCLCGGVLHSARYPRKPRGGPRGLGPDYESRLSFCCAKEGCRRRTTPPSVRFLGQRVYLGAVVVLVSAMEGGVTAKRAERLREFLGVSLRTLKRWRRWWRAVFVASTFWKQAKGHFAPPVDVAALPASLLERFAGHDVQARLIKVLHFLIPVTNPTKSGLVDGGL